MAIGEAIRQLREERGYKQGELARRVGIAHNTLSRIEVGKGSPTVDTLERLALALGVDASEILDAGKSHWALDVSDAEFDVWLERADKQELHRLFSAEIPRLADTTTDADARVVLRDRAGRAVDAFFDRYGIERVIDRRERRGSISHAVAENTG